MTHSGYWAKQSHSHATFDKSMSSTARDFRQLTPLVLMGALRRAGTRVLEPVHRFELELPADALGPVLPRDRRGSAACPATRCCDGATCTLDGAVPAARVHELRQRLPGLTRGEALLDTAPSTATSRSAARRRPVRAPTTTRSTARSTSGASAGAAVIGAVRSVPRRISECWTE